MYAVNQALIISVLLHVTHIVGCSCDHDYDGHPFVRAIVSKDIDEAFHLMPTGSFDPLLMTAALNTAIVSYGVYRQKQDKAGNLTDPQYFKEGKKYLKLFQRIMRKNPASICALHQGCTSLHRAARIKSPNTLSLILKNLESTSIKRVINFTDSQGFTPLHLSLECLKSVNILLRANADPNQRDREGYTTLHRAIEKFFDGTVELDTIRLLLEYNARPEECIKNCPTSAIKLAELLNMKHCMNPNGKYHTDAAQHDAAKRLISTIKEFMPGPEKKRICWGVQPQL